MFRTIFLVGFILSLGACAQNSGKSKFPEGLSLGVTDAYENDQAILLYYFDSKSSGSEAYADWVTYLEDFKRSEGADFYVQSFEFSELSSLVESAAAVIDFSLFIKAGHPSYLYSDVIVEPQVYRAVFHSYSSQEITDEDRAFMPEKVDLLLSRSK